MDRTVPRVSRARPRLDYTRRQEGASRRRVPLRKEAVKSDDVTYVRCGGGYRVVRRIRLPGDEP